MKRKHERGFRQKYTAQDFYEADKGKMKTEVLFEIRKIRFRCSVDSEVEFVSAGGSVKFLPVV